MRREKRRQVRAVRPVAIVVVVVVAAAVAIGLWLWLGRRGVEDSHVRLSTPGPARNLLLVTLDTCRADRVSAGLTPAITALGATGARFSNVRTAAPLTLPAHVSIMTGLFPPAHGVRQNGISRFDGHVPTLARLLRQSGFRTAAFVGAYVLDRRFGLNDGFDVYDDQMPRDPSLVDRMDEERRGDVVADRAIRWLDDLGRAPSDTRPFFLWAHFYDAHAPYDPPPAFLEKAHGQAYDGEIAFVDSQVARLLDALSRTGHSSDTLVVVAGDHGESLGEHGEPEHGMLLFEAALRVPLVIAGPGVPQRAVQDGEVSLVDVAPTILQLLGRDVPPDMHGANVLDPKRRPGDIYSETEYPHAVGWSAAYSLVEGHWKLLQSPGNKLFDLGADPGEQRDVAASHGPTVAAFAARVAEIRALAKKADSRAGEVPADVAARLRSLGYVASGSAPVSDSTALDAATAMEAWQSFQRARKAAAAHDYRTAIPLLKALVESHPESAEFESSYVTALQESGDARTAVDAGRRAAAHHPGDARIFQALAVAARDADLPQEAMRAAQAALALAPGDPTLHNTMGLLEVGLRQPREAAAAFERAAGLDPTNSQFWTNLGNARRELGALEASEQAYRRALDVDPTAADAANGLGALLVQNGRPGDAIAWFERALTITQGNFVEARLNLGIACQQAGQIDRAQQAFREVLQAPPRFARQRESAARLLASLSGRGGR